MRLLLDECAGGRFLRDILIADGHDVVRSVDVLGGGVDDPTVLAFACADNRAIVTHNNADFVRLAAAKPAHHGMLLVYQDNKPSDMTSTDIAQAIANVEGIHPGGIAGRIVVLNQYRW